VDRRRFLLTSLAGALAMPVAAGAQERTNLPRIAVLFVGPSGQIPSYVKAHEEGLQELGWTRNRNIIIEERYSGTMERMPGVVAELVNLNVRVIVTGPNTFIDVVKQVTSTVPIVMVYPTDPVGRGYVASLSRPGRNITGLAWDATPEIAGKYIDLLTEVRAAPFRVVGIVDPDFPDLALRKEAESAAKIRGLTLQYVEVRGASDVSKAFATITSQHANAIIVFQGPTLYPLQTQISEMARKNNLPTLSLYREGPQAGGLMSYGPNLRDMWRRAATYVDKILKGAKPGDLPIEQPTKFELVINLKTAKALGLTIPPSLLLRADQVIE
jgi:putative ABC transport system substrate-binding protein